MSATSTSTDFPPGGVGIVTHYGKVNLLLNRVAPSLDTFSTLGVARFRTSTFDVSADGAISIKTSATGDVDAATLGGVGGAFYLDAANHTGSVPLSRGGTGLTGVPANGAILIGNGTAYNLTTTPTFTGGVTFSSTLGVTGATTLNGLVNIENATSSTGLRLTGTSPTITLQDTDHNTGYIHVNSNIFFILRGATNADRGAWTQVNGRWPLEINLTNNNATFGGSIDARLGLTSGGQNFINYDGTADTGTENNVAMIELRDSGTTSTPSMSFHRPGLFATKIVLNTDNQLYFGGWSAAVGGQTIRTGTHLPGADNTYDLGSTTLKWNAINGFNVEGVAGNRWTNIPTVASNGVMEIGKFIDFHSTAADATDFTYRLDNISNGNLRCSGNLSIATGVLDVSSALNRDRVRLSGRAGGTGNFGVAITTGTLTANRTATLQDATGTIAFTGSSDYRMKKNINSIKNAISRLNALKVYRFNFKEEHILEGGLPTGLVDGFIAHELQEQMPEVVLGTKDEVDENGNPIYQSIDHSKMVPLLTAALQEALSEIELLKTRFTNSGL
jgi:hypothetical protein